MDTVSVIVPVYMGRPFLAELCSRIKKAIQEARYKYEIILVDDACPLNSWEEIKNLSQIDPCIIGLRLTRNFGQHYAITCGLDYASGDWIVVMDCDLQDSPEEIPNLLLKTKEGFHIVVARRGKRQDPAPKVMLSWLFYKTLGIFLARRIDPEVGNFRIISRQVANDFRRIGDRVRIFSVIVDWLGYPQAAVSVKHGTRPSGKSSYTFRKLCKLALDSLLVNLDRVIIWWAALGFLAAFLALIYGTYIFISWWISPSPIIGWTSTILSVTLFGGLNMLLLGIVGLYVGKTFEESRNRPLYIVCEATNAQNLIKNSACGPRTN